jgi:hypothetical protein
MSTAKLVTSQEGLSSMKLVMRHLSHDSLCPGQDAKQVTVIQVRSIIASANMLGIFKEMVSLNTLLSSRQKHSFKDPGTNFIFWPLSIVKECYFLGCGAV